ncbi:sodium-dependent bicarbonate transport family permease [Kamptonema cortianum]|nr:sodium-dependent bicarbonate transport family permease [Geitlerinema splendidum]MDK3160341.1 sodium-dependent bicarbonate transport family permease [Kamptonema cortianum]
MDAIELVKLNLLSPMVLCFVLGALAQFFRSDLKLPDGLYTALSIYLLLAIGLKGGVALSQFSLGDLILPIVGTVVLGSLIPVFIFAVCRGIGRLSGVDSAAIAAHYGSVSAVTFIACLTFLDAIKQEFPAFAPALVAVMEIPGIVVALLMVKRASQKAGDLPHALKEIITGKSILLLAGGMAIGALTGERGYVLVEPFFKQPFQGALCLFMIDMGLLAVARLNEVRKVGMFIVGLGVIAPLILGVAGVFTGSICGLNVGGSTILGVLAASASYIAAPAAVRVALPQANPSLYLTAAVGITFPFNLAIGIPLYYSMSQSIVG